MDPFQSLLHAILLVSVVVLLTLSTVNLSCFTLLFVDHRLASPNNNHNHKHINENDNVADRTCWSLFRIFRMDYNGGGFWTEEEGLLVQGFAVPFLALTAAVCLLPRRSQLYTVRRFFFRGGGDPNVHFWTALTVLLPGLLVTFWPQMATSPNVWKDRAEHFGVKEWQSRVSLLAAVTGDAAVMALSLFLVPVAKHSPLLTVFGLSFSQALVFHKVAGWISLVFSVWHGGLYLMDYAAPALMEGNDDDDDDQAAAGGFQGIARQVIPPARCWTLKALGFHGTDFGMTPKNITDTTMTNHFQPFLMDGHEREQLRGHYGCNRYFFNLTGLVSLLAFVVLGFFSLPRVRRRAYGLFYTVHIPMAWIMLLGAIAHITYVSLFLIPNIIYYLAPTVSVWIQQLVSSRRNAGVQLRSVTEIADSNGCCLVRLRNSTTEHEGKAEEGSALGSVVKICVPEISSIWHPFSAMKDPNNGDILVLIRPTGPFTTKLLSHLMDARTNDPVGNTDTANSSSPLSSSSLPCVLVDGVYPAEYRWHAQSLQHDSVLLVAGGVGIVPFLSLLSELYQSASSSQEEDSCRLRHVVLHWYCREEGLARFICQEFLPCFLRGATAGPEEENSDEDDVGAAVEQDERDRDERFLEARTITFELFIHVTSRPRGDGVGDNRDFTASFLSRTFSGDDESSNPIDKTVQFVDPAGIAVRNAHVASTNNWGHNLLRMLWLGCLFTLCAVVSWWYYSFATNTALGHSLLIRMYIVLVSLAFSASFGLALFWL